MSSQLLPKQILKVQFDILEFAQEQGEFTNISAFSDHYTHSYSKANGAVKSLVLLGFIQEQGEETKRLYFKITTPGKALLKACKKGDIVVKPNTSRTAVVAPAIVNQSCHDDIAQAFIANMAVPVATNSRLNECLSSVSGIVSNFIDDPPPELPADTPLDKHNLQLLKQINDIHRLCEKYNGTTNT